MDYIITVTLKGSGEVFYVEYISVNTSYWMVDVPITQRKNLARPFPKEHVNNALSLVKKNYKASMYKVKKITI